MVLSEKDKRDLDRELKRGEFAGVSKEAVQRVGRQVVKGFPVEEQRRRAFNPQRFPTQQIRQELTKEQMILSELMGGGERTWGTGQNLPKLNRQLMTGSGIIKSEDFNRETARCFGL